jgi:hypothetical protein
VQRTVKVVAVFWGMGQAKESLDKKQKCPSEADGDTDAEGSFRLRGSFASRTSHYAQDDRVREIDRAREGLAYVSRGR